MKKKHFEDSFIYFVMSGVCLIDLHNDFLLEVTFGLGSGFTVNRRERFLKRQIQAVTRYIKRAEKGGVRGVFASVWTTNIQDPMQQIRYFRRILDGVSTNIRLLLHIEDAWFINEHNIDEFIGLKPFSVGLTWNTKNNLAGGAYSKARLTGHGRTVIEKLVKNGVVIDLAHLNKTSFFQVARLLARHNKKLFCSHTCFSAKCPHIRNIDYRQIRTIVDSGGIIGLTLVGKFLSPNKHAKMQDIYNQIVYFIENFGEDNLAIGTDFFGTDNLPKGLSKYKHFLRFKKFLVSKGIKDVTIDKIFFGNANRFLTQEK